MANGRLTERNAKIAEMLKDGDGLKNFYRFVAQNPHIPLHDACQIIIERPNATVCYSFSEWTAMDRRVTKGRKGIAFYDSDGYKQFVFDANDTHGDTRYTRPILPMKRLLGGLDEINDTSLADSEQNDYVKIHKGVESYLKEQDELSGDKVRDRLLVEGITYSLYSKTGFPKSAGIKLAGLPYSYSDNADLVKEVYIRADMLAQDIEEAYRESREEVKVIDDTEEETVSDEPVVIAEQIEPIHEEQPKSEDPSHSEYHQLYKRYMEAQKIKPDAVVLMENGDNYVVLGENVKTLSAELNFTFIGIDVGLSEKVSYCSTPQKYVDEFLDQILERHSVLLVENDKEPKYILSHSKVQEQSTKAQEQPKVTPYYQKYLDAQKLNPKAVVVMRLGDFYEVMGENAKVVSAELDLTLTGREVGLPERVPMCGMPYHAMDKYLDRILKNHGVLLVDGDEEPKYIASYAEALGQGAEEEKVKPALTEITDNEPTPFDDVQSETDDDWRNELAAELTDSDEQEEPVEAEENDASEQDEPSEEESEKPKNKSKSTPKKPEQGIKDRKRKEKPQPTLFDLMDTQEQSAEEALIERQLKYGSGVEYGKFRIFDKYNENPSAKTFAEFLKDEYGWGGHGGWSGDDEMHDSKGITMSVRGNKGETIIKVSLKWPEVAVRIADLIDDDNYLSEQEKKEYVEYKVEQNRKREQRAEEERQKNEFIGKVIFAAPVDRKQRILDEYAKTTKLSDLAGFLKNEYGTTEETNAVYSATYNEMGVWIFKSGEENDYQKRIYLNWEEFADKVCNLIENDRYIEQPEVQKAEPPRDLDAEEDEDWDKLIDAGILKPVYPIQFNRFKKLSADDKAYFERYSQRDIIEPTNSLWGEVQNCTVIANGIYEVDTEGHGGVMIKSELAQRVLSLEALSIGYRDGGYLCYEEDCDAQIPLRELYDKGILNKDEYFAQYRVKSNRPEAVNGYVSYYQANDKEKSLFLESWNKSINESLGNWHPEYWQAYVQAGLSPEQRKINDIVDRIVKEGTEKTTDGIWTVYFEDFKDDEQFVREHRQEIGEQLVCRKEVARGGMDDISIEATFNLEYCPNYGKEEVKNTDLTGVLDQSELGGAKTRFKGNVAAIKLVNKLYSENRNPTEEEKKVLSQFVGWGGLSQAFDENNDSWKKEYAELKGLLSQDDYEQARSSTLNAYYTAKDVITGIYSALNRFGVKGNNRILEPSMGTGNFFGFMPKEISDGARLYGVELDNLTGRIAAKLYPQANVQIKGFEDTSFPNDKFDIVVGNVPFGGYGVADSAYNRYNFKVHDYFLAKSIDKVKPNGIVAIVTSKGTMDKLNPSARKYVAERAELLGAIRLPNTAFKQTAGTEAVADILFFRKRTERINTDAENIEWLGTGKTAEGYEINNYFIKHPEMVLGTLAEEVGLYGGKDVTVKPDGRELSEAIAEAVKNLPQGFYSNPKESPEAEEKEVDYNVKPMCYKADSGRLYMRVGDEMEEQRIPSFPKDAYQRIKAMIELREELHRVLDIQIKGCSDEVLQEEQRKLGGMYDLFVRGYGELNSQTNTRLFKEDGDSALLFACEDVDEETKKVSKAEVFYKRTIRPYIVPTSTDDPFEALQISKNERGKVDIAYIEELTGKSYDDVLLELGDAVFRDPEITDRTDRYSGFLTSEEYLSGRVVDKLNTARLYAEEFPEFNVNVEALEKVQPTPLTASEISVRLGQTWVDKEIYKEFYCELVGVNWWRRGDVELFYNPFDSSWRLDQKDSVRSETQMKQKEVYGTRRAPAYRLFIDCMNLKATTIYDTIVDPDGKERRVLNHPETIAAREKQNQIKEAFTNWIFAKPERREQLEETYNRLFNRIRLPSYDGSYLKFPEMNPAIELKPHQKNAVHRIISNNQSTLLHHVVGSGKTYTMVASIMKMRQLGICKKAMVAVPNHLVQQWASEWRKLYPNAKILVATKEDLEKDNRQKFISKVAMGDWDGIIIAQSSFAKIPISQERQIKKLQQEITLIEETVKKQWEESGMPRGAVKNLERIKKTKQAQLKKLMEGNGKDNVLTFESLGVDYLYVDEAHYYKNLFLFTKMNNVAGVSNAASQRASDLKLKCEYLQELHGSDRGIVFATGTPISNSMSEMYTMQSYLQPSELKASGISFFDGWAADFGETITSMELAPSGQGYKARTRFAKFTNLPELLTMYRSFADVQTQDMVKLNVPEAERHVINLKPSDNVIELAEKIAERAEKIHGGSVTPEVDNMLKVTSDGKKLALDPRCFVPESEDEAGSKLNEAAQRIHEIWEKTADIRGTQIVFCDLSTPKVKSEEYVYGLRFDAYNDLKYKLVQKGIPANEIAFIHDATTDEQKQALFDKVNSGAIRVLIGSTEKCGAGTNVQKRLVALHHLDTPYRPSDMEQREGRIIRQGNTNAKVDIYTYVTERTFDSYSYQILENKQKFISQINRGDLTVREAEDIDETTLTYAEIKAITAANPKIKRKMEVDAEISRLRILEGQYKKHLYDLQDKIRKDFPENIRQQELLMERVSLDLMHLNSSKPTDPEAFEISVNGKVYTDRKEGGKALTDAFIASSPEKVIAEYCGFKISVNPMTSLTGEREITLTANGQYTIGISDSSSGNLTRLDNFIEDFPKRLERIEKRLQQMKDDLKVAEEEVEKPFEHKDRLLELLSEQTELNAELDLDKKEEVIIADENDTDDDNYKALPAQTNYREDEIIDKEDKVALMQVAVLPDYSLTQEDMYKYGYTWDGMLPVRQSAAIRLFNNGVQIHKLGKDDTETEVGYLSDIEENALYGVEKSDWKNYIESENGLAYLATRSQFARASKAVTSKELDSVDERFTGDFIETNYMERSDLDKYLADKPKIEAEAMKSYTSQLLDEFSGRIWRDELKYYGWDEITLKNSIVNHIENEELKAEAKRITDIPFNAEKELMTILGGMTEEEIEDMDLPAFDDELTVLEKQPAYLVHESRAIQNYLDGLLLLRNDTTGSNWYVINDTYAKNKDGNYLEKDDKTDVMTVLAYNGLYDGNPLKEFYSEDEARAYFDERVKAINEVRINSAKFNPLIVGGGSEQDKIFAIMDDYCKMSERRIGGTEDCVGAQMLADNVNCPVENVKELMAKYGARINGDDIWLNGRLQTERRVIANRPNYSEFVSKIRQEFFERQKEDTGGSEEQGITPNEVGEMEDYVEEVISSVKREYDDFKKEMLNSSPDEVFRNNYKIHLYNEFSEVIQCGKEYLSDKDFQALHEDSGHILYSLYDDYLGCENYSVETYSDTAVFIKDYCEDHHNEIYYPTTYYGKDTENRAYYSTTQGISLESLRWFDENADADMITIAAPACYVDRNELEKRHIFYLNIGRDISADALEETNAMTSMMKAMDNYKRIYPLYLQSTKYANEHYEMTDYRNSHRSNEECKQALTEAIRNNFDGMHLNAGFEDKLIEQYGMERVAFIVATTINEHDYDGRYSRDNKAWAKTIPMSESEDERSNSCLNVHPAVLDGFTNRIRKKYNENHSKPAVYYATKFDENGTEDKAYIAVYLDNESGEIRTLFGANPKTEKEIDELAYKVNHDVNLPRNYTLVKTSYEELSDMSKTIIQEKNEVDNRPPEVNELMQFAESADYKKTKAYYTFMYVRGPNGTGQYQVYMLDEGETEMYPMFEDVIKTEAELERKWNELVRSGVFAPMELIKCEPQELLKMSNQNNQEENKLAQDKYKNFTARGDKVLSIVKDRDDRNIAIIQRKNDFVVAARYDTTDGRWAQGFYDFTTLEAAEKFRTEKYGFENTSDTTEKKWLTCKVSPEALIKKYQFNSRFAMPQGSGYEGYAYSIFNDRIKEGTITTDLKSDTRERALVINIPTNQNVELRKGEESIELEPHEFFSLVNGTTSDKYEREARMDIRLPREAVIKEYDTSMLVAMPADSDYKGYVYYLPNSVVSEDKESDDGSFIANVGENFKITLRKGEEKVEFTAKEFAPLIEGKTSYKREPSELDEYREQSENDKSWNTVAVSENAVIANYENSTLFKMPKGDFEGLVYYIPSGMVRKEDDGLYLRIPEDFEVHLKGGDEPKDLTAQEFLAAIEGKTDEDYENIYRKPSAEARKQFEKVEAQLRQNVPEEMLKKPNWVIVRTRENNETGRLDKFLIDAHTGKFAESDNPETWTDFDTACEYAKENGGVCLAYALDGKDGIACIDLDGCMEVNGDFSETANQVFDAVQGSYTEKSVSGKGLHIFGKTKGADLRSFSKDKTMEYYQDTHFIAMTGDFYGSSELKSFDTPEMKGLLESKLEKRTEWKNTGMGVEGLSSMDDREMLDRAFGAKNGDIVKRLYNGEDLRHNRSNSDMSLMNYLAFWSNHDVDQMLRVFSTSGLYRPEKPQSYYEHTALKAIKSTPCYTPPKASNNKPSGNGNGSGKGGK